MLYLNYFYDLGFIYFSMTALTIFQILACMYTNFSTYYDVYALSVPLILECSLWDVNERVSNRHIPPAPPSVLSTYKYGMVTYGQQVK